MTTSNVTPSTPTASAPTTADPTFYITPLRPSDAPALAHRIAAAFDTDALHHSWVAPISPPSERSRQIHAYRSARLAHSATHPVPGKFFIVARRTQPGQPPSVHDEAVGFAVWEAPCDVAAETGATTGEPAEAEHAVVLTHVRASIGATLAAMRARVWGSETVADFWGLTALAVDPACQGKGVGGMLVAWGCARADQEGKDAYVESSEAAIRTYERAGFVAVSEERDGVDGWMEFEYGGRRCAMVRRAKANEGAS